MKSKKGKKKKRKESNIRWDCINIVGDIKMKGFVKEKDRRDGEISELKKRRDLGLN